MTSWGLPQGHRTNRGTLGHRTRRDILWHKTHWGTLGHRTGRVIGQKKLLQFDQPLVFIWLVCVFLQQTAVTCSDPFRPVCGDNLTASAGHLSQSAAEEVISTQHCDKTACHQCVYFIHAPSKEQTIALNFTNIYGFRNSTGNCLPKVDILEWDRETGVKSNMASICKENNNLHTPQAFRSQKGSVKLTYIWPHGQYHCGFQVEYSFHALCAAKCDDGNCLATPVLLCNGQIDCKDGSDESEEKCRSTSKSSLTTTPSFSSNHYTSSSSDFTYIILIASIILVTLLLAAMVITYNQCLRSTSNTPPRRQNFGHNQLRPHLDQPGSGVIYLPGPVNEDCQRHQESNRARESAQERQIRNLTINLPPSIPISLDGEEGYDRCYQYHQSTALNHRLERESMCPPPNRTIFDGESPPPYRSHSVGRLDRPNSRLGAPPRGSIRDCSESPHVERCYSMSNNNKPSLRNTSTLAVASSGVALSAYQQQQQQPRRTRHSTGHSPPSVPAHPQHGPPPGYSDVILGDYRCAAAETASNGTQL